MALISGVHGTGNVLAAKRVIDMASRIDVLEPDSSPLTQLTKKLSKRVAINPKYNWLEEEAVPAVNGINYSTGYTSADTTMIVDNYTYLRAGDIVKAPVSGEQLKVVTTPSSSSVVFSRGYGTTSAGNLADDAVLLVVGNANQEGASVRSILTAQEVEKTNYTQIFRRPFGITDTADNSEMYGGKDLAHVREMQMIEHQKDIERAFWFGEPKEDTTGTHPLRVTGGLDFFISTYSADASGTLTESEWEAWLRTGFRYGSSTKFVFASPIVISAVSSWATGKLQMLPRDKTYGIAVTQYLSPHGVINLVNMKLFGETPTYSGASYLVDLEGISYRFIANRDTKLKTNIQANDVDGETDEYITECGFQLMSEKKCSYLYGVTSFA